MGEVVGLVLGYRGGETFREFIMRELGRGEGEGEGEGVGVGELVEGVRKFLGV